MTGARLVRCLELVSAASSTVGRGKDEELTVWERPPGSRKGLLSVCVCRTKPSAKHAPLVLPVTSCRP